MKNVPTIALLLCLLISCKDDDVVPNRVIFKMTLIDPQYGSPKWIVLKDNETGELIDSRQLVAGEPAVFESTKKIRGNKMTVTFLKITGGGTSGNAMVFRGVDVGTEWTQNDDVRNKSNPDSPSLSGTYSLAVTNAPQPYSFTVSDLFGPINLNVDPVYSDGKITIEPGIRTGYKQIISIDPVAGKQKFTFIDNLSGGEKREVDYSTFKEFDKYVNVDPAFVNPNIYVFGYENAAKYYNTYGLYSSWLSGVSKSPVVIGFLNQFQNYRIQVFNASPYTYNYLGPAPAVIKPQASPSSFKVTNKARLEYAIQADANYDYSKSSYDYPSGGGFLTVEYFDPKGDVKHFDPFTDEIMSKYSIDLTKLRYVSTEVTVGQTYSRILDYYFAATYDASQPYEITTIYYSDTQ